MPVWARAIWRRKNGFTLVELIVVLVILAILAALLIPALTGYLDKARRQAAIAECRACVTAAQTLAVEKYAAGGELELDSGGAVKRQIKTLAEVPDNADISRLTVTGGRVEKLTYVSAGKITVTYENGAYAVADGTEDAVLRAASSFLEKAIVQESSYAGKYHSGDDLIEAMGPLPSVSPSSLFGDTKIYTGESLLYWRPKTVTIDGKTQVYLFANVGSAGHAAWQAFAIYYHGTVYLSADIAQNGTINRQSTLGIKPTTDDFGASLLASGKWKVKP